MDQPIVLLIVAAIVFMLVVGLGFTLRVNAKRKGLRDRRSIDADVTGELKIDDISEAVAKEKEATRGSEVPTEPANRLVRLRERLAKSNSGLGRGLLSLLSRDNLDESTWEEIEDTLILADVGVDPTTELVDRLRERVKVLGTREPEEVRGLLREELIKLVDPTMDRELAVSGTGDDPAVMLVVGVNGAGKTTTVGKIARVLVAEDQTVLLGAADTFRAAAAEQLSTWGGRVGVETVRGEEGADPASVAYSAVERGKSENTDVVLIDTAGRLQNKIGLMDELGKVKRVATRPLGEGHEIDEVLLVLDATTGQNGMQQAKVFAEAVNITGIVLTKLDGTAKGGIVVAVQRELGVPVKLIGLGEGADDLAPFTAEGFVDALLD
ncbi:MAG: signal recognition particle-docking protein FtsY [Brevibacterium aurantiacum]|uniref:Signal recognition particle receptor FtsY n=2 Tax=Brevibacterium TaxID=1696 RepID=A0A2A3ZES4_BREAU|nr:MULTISPECIES: signal recognition particle-docking protein FtsY [Brevibacterium]AZL06355.1 signal recognition particle-docking protein FtsY [Brevibacterium aurantiacum]AZL09916.1 signal recognition particle-docking protein FtsY [Brevibacterium aurantiacum]AZL13566.1 signal recognition particle-docking protein FtsY [Brevibacterium aurantiacum]AZT94070.1 signal recognition particle-docking protein FtsY [Brevibacterium aurantiacum]AZT97876.1 signal recognition particle-docking protein FtsY [Bre